MRVPRVAVFMAHSEGIRGAKRIRLQPSRRTVLFNGALECRLYEYRMVSGGNRR